MKIITIFLTFLSLNSYSSELQKSSDVKLAHILTTMEELYKSEGFPIVQLIQTWEEIAECGGSHESCPNARLLITSSMGNLYEAPLLYELPKSKGWEVLKSEDSEHDLYITVKTTLEHANVSLESRKAWSSETYNIKISKYSGLVSLVK